MAFELITVLIVLAAILVALRPGVLLNSVYAFAEIMNMQSIRELLDNEDPASYEYYQQLASVSDNNYYMIEVFDPDGNTVYSNREKFLYSGSGDSVYYRTAESMYTTGRSVRVFDLLTTAQALTNMNIRTARREDITDTAPSSKTAIPCACGCHIIRSSETPIRRHSF